MNPILKNILAVIVGLIIGSIVNMLLLGINGSIIPLPDGADVSSYEGLRESMKLFGPEHYIAPFAAHAGGTLVGAFLAALIAASHKIRFAMLIGALFFIGGLINVFMLGSPLWYSIIDLLFAYMPMAWFGYKIAGKFSKN